MDAFLNSLGLTLLYLALLGIGIIYAVIILIGGALHDVHLPGIDLHIGGHEIGPVHVENPLQGVDVGGDVGHPEVNVPSLLPIELGSAVAIISKDVLVRQFPALALDVDAQPSDLAREA
jgi:hypothetical protein